jgi:hypothetical protein
LSRGTVAAITWRGVRGLGESLDADDSGQRESGKDWLHVVSLVLLWITRDIATAGSSVCCFLLRLFHFCWNVGSGSNSLY